MPKSIPSVGDQNWGSPLNEHLSQLNNPATGGFNIWFSEENRPWANGDNTHSEEDNYTGFNEATGVFERWDASEQMWVIMQPIEQNPLEITPPGNSGLVELKADNTVNTFRYLFLENLNNDLDTYASLGDIIEITDASDSNKLKYYSVTGNEGTNKLRVVALNPELETETNTVTVRLNTDGEGNKVEVQEPGNSDYFNVGDSWRASDTGGTITEIIDSFTSYQSSFSAIPYTSPRTILSIYRAPQGTNAIKVFKPTIKYNDIYNRVAFSTDRFGTNSMGRTNIITADNLPEHVDSDLITQYRQVLLEGDQIQTFFNLFNVGFAVDTAANTSQYNAPKGFGFNIKRKVASLINQTGHPDLNDLSLWNGNLGEIIGVNIDIGHEANLQDGTTTVTSPIMTALKVQGDVRGGKIGNMRNIVINPTFVDSGNGASQPDQLWGIIERTQTASVDGHNFLTSNTRIGSSAGPSSNGAPTYGDITDKLEVYGNASINASSGSGGTTAGDLTVENDINYGGALNNTSDERLKENITDLSPQSVLESIQKIQPKAYTLKNDSDKHKRYGVIAQELESVLPELVSEGKDGYKRVNYIDMIPILIEGLKAQQQQIDELKKKLNNQ